ncbi:uncharacterized protein N0V89_001801 [Didymosphaeria variabile]|uniref:Rhodopsin domain-containing protein n=1 Tax=Didymosphaeria variabile TaxID=1932322 RepID=A0A9W8XQX6_9PLEO|nr:uncharacterized protein N0V89_001801 [Didymosphaeria variabile]KAJ4357226.1 hypothetical protein N0V89_001801 [Didymosphaeria variabile]
MATAVAMPPYSNNSSIYLVPVTILGVIALVLVVLRTYTRATRTRRLYVDDWLILGGEVLSLLSMSFAYTAISHGWGKPMAYVAPSDLKLALKMQFGMQLSWLFSLCLVRLSVAASLLRFDSSKWWKWTLYSIMGLQCLITTSYFVIQLGQCTPIAASWETVPDVVCWPTTPIVNYGWAVSGIYILMDLAFSLMPIKLIRGLSRSTSEKALIGFLMSLGLLATAILCAKMSTFLVFGAGDALQATMLPSTYAILENIVGIIACSLPALKSPTERILKKLGILKEHQLTRPSFVNTVQLSSEIEHGADDSLGSQGSSHLTKHASRIDSVAFKTGSVVSSQRPGTGSDVV